MNGERMLVVFLIELLGGSQQGKGGVSRFDGVNAAIHVLENRHETIAGSLVDVATGLMDTIEKGGKIAFDQRVDRLQGQSLAQAAVATDVKEEDRNVPLVLFGQPRRRRVGSDKALDRLGHKLGEMIFDLTQFTDFTVYGVLEF